MVRKEGNGTKFTECLLHAGQFTWTGPVTFYNGNYFMGSKSDYSHLMDKETEAQESSKLHTKDPTASKHLTQNPT